MKASDLCFLVPFTRIRRGLKVAFIPESGEGGGLGSPTSLGKSLAMAHFFDQALVAQGAGALRRLAECWGIRPQRLAQVHALIYLAPDLQEAILLSRPEAGKLTFHSLVAIARKPLWAEQREAWRLVANPYLAESISGRNRAIGNIEGRICPQGQARTRELALIAPSESPSPQTRRAEAKNAGSF